MATPVVSLTSWFRAMMKKEKNAKECDATKAENDLNAGKQKIQSIYC